MKKIIISALLALLLVFSVSAPVMAATIELNKMAETSVEFQRADQFRWYYRIYNGENQKRLWNLTREIWVTDWMPV